MIALLINLLVYLFVVMINFLANYLPINGQRTGEISDKLNVLFTPAGYVFSIWGLIYLLLGIWVLCQIPKLRREDPIYKETFPWFAVSCVLNSTWIIVWHYELFILSVLVIVALLLSLIVIYTKIKKVPHSFFEIAPFSIYLGWISVATITNIAYTLKYTGWNGFGISDIAWTIIMLLIATILAIVFRIKNQDWLYPLVFVWAFIGIAVKNGSKYPDVQMAASILTGVLVLLILFGGRKTTKYN